MRSCEMTRRKDDPDYLPLFDAAPVDETPLKHEENGGFVTVAGVDDANRAFLEAAADMEE